MATGRLRQITKWPELESLTHCIVKFDTSVKEQQFGDGVNTGSVLTSADEW